MRVSERVKSIEEQIAGSPKSATFEEATTISRAGSLRSAQEKAVDSRDEPEVMSPIGNHVSEQADTGDDGKVVGEVTARQPTSVEPDVDGNLDTHVELMQQHQRKSEIDVEHQKVGDEARITRELGNKQPLLEEESYAKVETKPELKQDHLRPPESTYVLTSTAEMDVRCQSDLTEEINVDACVKDEEEEKTQDHLQSESLSLESCSDDYSELTDERSDDDESNDEEWKIVMKQDYDGLDNTSLPLYNEQRRERSLTERSSEDDGSMLTDEAEIDIDRSLRDDKMELLSNHQDTIEHQPKPNEAESEHRNLNTKCLNEKAITSDSSLTSERNLCVETNLSHERDTFNDLQHKSGIEHDAIERHDVEQTSDFPATEQYLEHLQDTEQHLEHLQDTVPHHSDENPLSTDAEFSCQDCDGFSGDLHREAALQESPPESRNPKETTPFEYEQKSPVSHSEVNDVNKLLQEMEKKMDKRFRRLEKACEQIPVVMERLQQYQIETKHIDGVATVTSRSAQSAPGNELGTGFLRAGNGISTLQLLESIETDNSNLGVSSDLQAFVTQLESTTENAIADILLEDLDEAPSDETPVSTVSSRDESEVSYTYLSREVMEFNSTEVRPGKIDDYHSGSENSSKHSEPGYDESTVRNDTREPAPALEWTCMPVIVELQHDSAAALEQLVGFLDEQQTFLCRFCLGVSCGNDNDDAL